MKFEEEVIEKHPIDPKDLMAVERSTTALIGTAISLIVLGFVAEKFELFLELVQVNVNLQKAHLSVLKHMVFYKELGIGIVLAGVVLALFTYRYYVRWIRHLEERRIDTDKPIYFYLALFVASIGVILALSMIFL